MEIVHFLAQDTVKKPDRSIALNFRNDFAEMLFKSADWTECGSKSSQLVGRSLQSCMKTEVSKCPIPSRYRRFRDMAGKVSVGGHATMDLQFPHSLATQWPKFCLNQLTPTVVSPDAANIFVSHLCWSTHKLRLIKCHNVHPTLQIKAKLTQERYIVLSSVVKRQPDQSNNIIPCQAISTTCVRHGSLAISTDITPTNEKAQGSNT